MKSGISIKGNRGAIFKIAHNEKEFIICVTGVDGKQAEVKIPFKGCIDSTVINSLYDLELAISHS